MDTETNHDFASASEAPEKSRRNPESSHSTAAAIMHEFAEPEPAKRRRTFILRQKRL